MTDEQTTYVVMGWYWDGIAHSEQDHWPVCVIADKVTAEGHAAALTAEAHAIKEAHERGERPEFDPVRFGEGFDPQWHVSEFAAKPVPVLTVGQVSSEPPAPLALVEHTAEAVLVEVADTTAAVEQAQARALTVLSLADARARKAAERVPTRVWRREEPDSIGPDLMVTTKQVEVEADTPGATEWWKFDLTGADA